MPEHVRSLTSQHVVKVEADFVHRLARRAEQPAKWVRLYWRALMRVDPTQAAVVGALAGDGQLAFSARTSQIHCNIDRYEAEWRREYPGEEPGPRLREGWDRRAWAAARPDKVVPTDGADLVARWIADLRDLGYRDPAAPAVLEATGVGRRPGVSGIWLLQAPSAQPRATRPEPGACFGPCPVR